VLWILALLSILVITFTGDARTELRIARNQYEIARARALADAGVSFAILGLLDASPETRWRAAGEEHEIAYSDGSIRVSAQDEAGKISLNDASDEMFASLFRTLGESAAASAGLAAAITEWRERKRSEQASASTVAGTQNQQAPEPFLAIEELRLVPGVTRVFYERASPYLTVYAESAQVDPLTAPPEVLRSLPGLSAQQVDAYLADRTQRGGSVYAATLPPVPGLSPFLANPAQRTVTITSEGRTASGTQFVREAVVATTGARDQPYRLLVWRRARSRQEADQGE
jgi:general secretion pathway protein K